MMSVRLAVFLGVLLIVSFPLVGVFGEFLRSFSTITRLIGVSGLARPSRCSSGSSGGTPNRTIYLRTEAAALTVDDRRARVFDGVTLAECANRCTSGFQDIDCTAFEYESEKRRCALLQFDGLPLGSAALRSSAVRDAGRRHSTGDRAFFQSVCVPVSISCPAPYAFERIPQHVLVGHAMEVVPSASVSDCLRICLNSTVMANAVECRSAMYFYERGECMLNRETRRSAHASHLFTNDTRMQLVDYFENNCIDVSCGSNDEATPSTLHWVGAERFSTPSALRELMVDDVTADECRQMCADNRVDAQPFPCRAYVYGRIGGDDGAAGRRRCRLSADGGLYDGGDAEAVRSMIDAHSSPPPPSPFDDVGEPAEEESSAERATHPIPIMPSALAPLLLDRGRPPADEFKFLPSSFAGSKLLGLGGGGGGGGSESGDGAATIKPPDGFTRQLMPFATPSTERYYEKRCLAANPISIGGVVRCTDTSFEIVPRAMLNCRDTVLPTRSVSVCLATCLRMSGNCGSVNFNRKLDECVLNRRSRFSNPDLFRSGGNSTDISSWDYYDNLCDYAGGTATVFADAEPFTVNDNSPTPINSSAVDAEHEGVSARIDGMGRHELNYEKSLPPNGSNSAAFMPKFSPRRIVNETLTIQTDCRRAGVDVRVQFHDAPSTGALFVKERAATCAARFVATRHAYLRIRLERRGGVASAAAPPQMSAECAGVETQPLVLSYMVVVQRVAMSESDNNTTELLPSTFLFTGAERIFNVTCDFRGMSEKGPSITPDASTATPVSTTVGVLSDGNEEDGDLQWKGVKTVPKSSAIRFHGRNEESIVSTTALVPSDESISSAAQSFSSLSKAPSIMEEAAGRPADGTAEKSADERIVSAPLVHGQRVRMAVWRHDGAPARSVALGDALDIRWTLTSDSVRPTDSTHFSANTPTTAGYGFFVDNCTAERVGGHSPQPPPLPLFVNGCPDPRVYGQLVRSAISPTSNVSTAGTRKEVGTTLTASIRAFRFDGSLRVRVRCSVVVCVERCAPANCGGNVGGVTSFGRRRRRRQSSATIGELEELLRKYEEARAELARQHAVGNYESRPSGGSAMITGSYTVTDDDNDNAPPVPIEPLRQFKKFSAHEKPPKDEDNESISRSVDKSLRRITITKSSNSGVESSVSSLEEVGRREEPVHNKAPPPVVFRQRGALLLPADAPSAVGLSTSLSSSATSDDEDSTSVSTQTPADSKQSLVNARDAVCLRRSLFIVCLVVLAFLSTFQAVYLLQKCCRRFCNLCDEAADPPATTKSSATSSSSDSAEIKASSLSLTSEKQGPDFGTKGFDKSNGAKTRKPMILDEIVPFDAVNGGRTENNQIGLRESDSRRKSTVKTFKPYVEPSTRERGFLSDNGKERHVMLGHGYSTALKNNEARKEKEVSLRSQQFSQQPKLPQYSRSQPQQQSVKKQQKNEKRTDEQQQYACPQQQQRQQFAKKKEEDFAKPMELSHHRQPLFSSKQPTRDEESWGEKSAGIDEGDLLGGGNNDTVIVIPRHYPLSQFVPPRRDEMVVADGAGTPYFCHCDRCVDGEESGWSHVIEEPHGFEDDMTGIAHRPSSFIINAADLSRFYKISGDVDADDSTVTAGGRHSNDQDDRSSFLSFNSVVERPLPVAAVTREGGATSTAGFPQAQRQQQQAQQQQQQLLLLEDNREALRRCASRREGPYFPAHVNDSKEEDVNADELFNYFPDDHGAPPNHENNAPQMPRVMPRTKFFTVGRTNNFGAYFNNKQLQRQQANNGHTVVTTTRFASMRLWNKQQKQHQQRFSGDSHQQQQQMERQLHRQQQTYAVGGQRQRRLTVAVDPTMLEASPKHLSELV